MSMQCYTRILLAFLSSSGTREVRSSHVVIYYPSAGCTPPTRYDLCSDLAINSTQFHQQRPRNPSQSTQHLQIDTISRNVVYVPRILRARRISTGNSLNEHVSLTIPQRIPFCTVSPTRCGQHQSSTAARPIFPLAHSKAKQIGPQTARISDITQPLAAPYYTPGSWLWLSTRQTTRSD